MLESGLYEELINNELEKELKDKDESQKCTKTVKDKDVSEALSRYLTNVIREGLESCGKKEHKLKVANEIISLVEKETGLKPKDRDVPSPEILYAYIDDKKQEKYVGLDNAGSIVRPLTSLSESSLFTGAKNDPQMFEELKREIVSSDSIDMLVSFIKWSGLVQIINELREFTNNNGHLRIISTCYMGATELKAIEELNKLLHTEIKISYDTKITRLHAKAYIFHRNTGFSTAYIGSSNLSKAAMSSGLEWNIKITQQDLDGVFEKVKYTFESYWNSEEFESYSEKSRPILQNALRLERHNGDDNNGEIYTIDVRPYSYQKEILDKLEAEREVHNSWKNLIVAATGTGKTVIAALDYKNFVRKNQNSQCTLLFVAHREEILKQSRATFRQVLREPNFGELLVGSYNPSSLKYLFVSIQSLNSRELIERMKSDFYDYIVVDEFHHAAARSYQDLLNYYKPKILLGLTATPERMDGGDILRYFNNHIAAEIRLPEAIDRKLLCPFQYFGVADGTDLSRLQWTKGYYDKSELSNLYCLNTEYAKRRANLIVESINRYLADINKVKGLGFCVSKEHAKFMATYFNSRNISSMSLTSDDNEDTRNNAKNMLVSGNVKFIFVVDIYNEGVDIPEINTILFLRPTESLTVFLQQLGRGLRQSEDKDYLTVLDFIGRSNTKYNFASKFMAIARKTETSFIKNLEENFIPAPTGCYIQLEKQTIEDIKKTITASYGDRDTIVKLLRGFRDETEKEPTISSFLDYYNLDPRLIYKRTTFSDLLVEAGIKNTFSGEPLYKIMHSALKRFVYMNSRELIGFTLSLLETRNTTFVEKRKKLMLKMIHVTIWDDRNELLSLDDDKIQQDFQPLFDSTTFVSELKQLLEYKKSKIDFVDKRDPLGFDCPLALHCAYTMKQVIVAVEGSSFPQQAGVSRIDKNNLDTFFITLNKSEKNYSPTTMYKDYSINENLFHWQSQNTTSSDTDTGKRYINHDTTNDRILLFVREDETFENKRCLTEAYTYLGKAHYVSHEGEKPMSIIWRLDEPIPAAFVKKTNTLLAM